MKYILVLSIIVAITQAQRPSYASSGPIGRPGLASRFKEDNASTSTTTTGSTVSFENRVGAESSTIKIPVDAKGDVDLVNTLNSWDREHQPFWFINADHIEKARNTTRAPQTTGQNQNGQATQTQQNQNGQNGQTTQITNRNPLDSLGNRNGLVGNQGNQVDFQGFPVGQNGALPRPNDAREWQFGRPQDVAYNQGGLQRFPPLGDPHLRNGFDGNRERRIRFHRRNNNFVNFK